MAWGKSVEMLEAFHYYKTQPFRPSGKNFLTNGFTL